MEIKLPDIHKMEKVEFEPMKSLTHNRSSWQIECNIEHLEVSYK